MGVIMKKKIDHIGIAVRDLDNSISIYENILGGTLIDRYQSDAIGVESEIAIMEVNGDRIELLSPTNNSTSPIARFIKQKGKGVHHIAYQVENLDEAIKHGRRLIYLNPADTEGTIIEYCDYPHKTL
jgi:methylmalonyl-CoA/ethylmalonyl-CoA epimerase